MGDSSRLWWRRGRFASRVLLGGWFILAALRVGPDLIIYRRLTHPDPADFVDLVNTKCAPVVRGLVAYQRDHGQSANSLDDLTPKYLPPYTAGVVWFGRSGDPIVFPFFEERLRVTYKVDGGVWVWRIEGPALDGVVPAPLVAGYPPPENDDVIH